MCFPIQAAWKALEDEPLQYVFIPDVVKWVV